VSWPHKSQDENEDKDEEKERHLIMAFCGAMAATSVQRCVWLLLLYRGACGCGGGTSQEQWWDCDVNSSTETDLNTGPQLTSSIAGRLPSICITE